MIKKLLFNFLSMFFYVDRKKYLKFFDINFNQWLKKWINC